MAAIDETTATLSSPDRSDLPCPHLLFTVDCSPFLNWSEDRRETGGEKAVVFRSLVATVKCQPALDTSLEAKAVNFLESVIPQNKLSDDTFLDRLTSFSDESMTEFVQSFGVILSSPNRAIITATLEIIEFLIWSCSLKLHLALVNANLIPQLIDSLNPQSLSLTEAVDIHTSFMGIISHSLMLTTHFCVENLEHEDADEQQAVHETILNQVLVPSEKYICHLCANRYFIVIGEQSNEFMILLARILLISSNYQPTMKVIIHMPVTLTIPSCLTFFEDESSIYLFLDNMNNAQRDWNKRREEYRQRWKTVNRGLRMEGSEDVIEGKLRNDKDEYFGGRIVVRSIDLSGQQGMNAQKLE
ncbi:hypothetical protein BLNAU_5354 [Blattamonas nauphoetae]|uniref:Uncharacterized protein n=1 Tax=Blattamonas nauphoetae TaxID=2049346 RepID=A0ABQ9Y727_9EUKA|nr:hypothetical protein BLNAU_5354 [Blattamonas nauphoetae]